MKKFLPLLLFIVLLTSCKKDDKPSVVEISTALPNTSWKLTGLTVSPSLFGYTDLFNNDDIFEPCDRDDLFVFQPNYVFVYDNGVTACSAGEPETRVGSWAYNKSAKTLTWQNGPNGMADVYTLTVTSFNGSVMQGTMTDIIDGDTYITTWTFIKI